MEPYSAMFGVKAKMGVASSVPSCYLEKLQNALDEEVFESVINGCQIITDAVIEIAADIEPSDITTAVQSTSLPESQSNTPTTSESSDAKACDIQPSDLTTAESQPNIPTTSESSNAKASKAHPAVTLRQKVSENLKVFEVVKYKGLKVEDVPQDCFSVRELVRKMSVGSGQGYQRCSCKKSMCRTLQCRCFKNKVHCNSACHPQRTCANNN
ncbi:uncharacterized protein [Bemisia tabaci]|uniref:uncharacterized protein n=1 Tax=Bemisia tabaci TaxID=7038 RepID=UPI003B289713